ncbi:hypothetical protein FB451DRAFT_1549116 [Mycena latifolia]|nr:hypothetical protein FB451DRAFT_1549116 [Mycena latifolia]
MDSVPLGCKDPSLNPYPRKKLHRYGDFRTKLDRIDAFMQALEKVVKRPRDGRGLRLSFPTFSHLQTGLRNQRLPCDARGAGMIVSPAKRPRLHNGPSASLRVRCRAYITLLDCPFPADDEFDHKMARMATQLKRNATHFHELLAADQGVIEETAQKLEENSEYIEKMRARTGGLKTGSTTCLAWVGVLPGQSSFSIGLLFLQVRFRRTECEPVALHTNRETARVDFALIQKRLCKEGVENAAI